MNTQKHKSFIEEDYAIGEDSRYIFSGSESICTEFEAFRRMQREEDIEYPSGADLRERYVILDEGSDTPSYIPRNTMYHTGY